MDAAPTGTEPGRSGCMVAVVGPSGAGKDTLMDYAARFSKAAKTSSLYGG